ncbi:MAG TPA: ParB/Srx family N-terminal domain-containing protein [Armatimonadota bacterium]|nr:ParB/Srx family N-terminal domain-containing protein [Armatimonadota bacterium]
MDTISLIPNPRNPNHHPDSQVRLLARIIKEQGWRAPITVSNRSGFIVRGHARLLAAQLAGWEQVPVDRQSYATEAEEWADLIADNRLAELAERDDEALLRMLRDCESEQVLNLSGYDDEAMMALLASVNAMQPKGDELVEVEPPEPPAQPVTQPGDIWLLGRVVACPRCGRLTDV